MQNPQIPAKSKYFKNPAKCHWDHTLCTANKNYFDIMNIFCKNISVLFIKAFSVYYF